MRASRKAEMYEVKKRWLAVTICLAMVRMAMMSSVGVTDIAGVIRGA